MVKAIVTGGAGFIGSHIVDKLIEEGVDVSVIDNLVRGRQENINKKAKFLKKNILDEDLIIVFEKEKPDYVFHLAAQIDVRKSLENPTQDAKVNILGTINLLECCRKTNVKKIIYSSTAGVYGNPEKIPCSEEQSKIPINFYGTSKLASENYFFTYNYLYGLDFEILRYSNVYGPRQDIKGEAGVIRIFIGKLLNKESPLINGGGNQTRDFIYVKDVAKANVLAMKNNTKSKIINIATNSEISINELFSKIKEISNSKVNAEHGRSIKGEIMRSVLDVTKAEKEIKFKAKVNLDSGLKKTVEFFKNN